MSKQRKRTELTIEEEILSNDQNDEGNKYRYYFAIRLNQLMEEKEITPKELETDFGIKQNTLTNYRRGRVDPQLTILVKLAEALGVSLDYLCGLSEYKAKDIEDLDISNKTGLSYEAIEVLKECNSTGLNYIRTINFLLEQESKTLVEEKIRYIKNTSDTKYARLKKLLNKKDYIPIISIINEYFLVKLRSNSKIHINDSLMFMSSEGKLISFADTISTEKTLLTRRSVSDQSIIDSVFLDEIKDKLKQAKPKYVSQFPSEVDNQ